MKSKPTRKNRYKRKKAVRPGRLRRRVRHIFKGALGMLALTVVSLAFILVYDLFTQAEHFRARRIDVTGNQRLDRKTILSIAGIQRGTNILAVNLAKTRRRLLAEPWIAEATVSRKIPSTLAIRIREQRPLAILDLEPGPDFLINRSGRVFKRADGIAQPSLPRVAGLSAGDLPVPGMPFTKTFRSVMTLLRLAGRKNSAMPLSDIRRIHLDREIGATVYLGAKGRAVKLGYGRYEEKIAVLGRLMDRYAADRRMAGYQAIDLFDISRIVVTPASAEPIGGDHEEV